MSPKLFGMSVQRRTGNFLPVGGGGGGAGGEK